MTPVGVWAVLAAILVALWIWRYYKLRTSKRGLNAKELDDMMIKLANAGIESAREVDGIALDYSEESVAKVDEILARVASEVTKGKRDQQSANAVSLMFGAYVGETIRRNWAAKARWDTNHPSLGPNTFPLYLTGTNAIFPVGWCHKRLLDAKSDSVALTHELFREKFMENADRI